MRRKTVWLYGDSMFDNNAYIGRTEMNVAEHLEYLSTAKLDIYTRMLARDGAVINDVLPQIQQDCPCWENTNEYMVVAVGGNDALKSTDLLSAEITSASEYLDVVTERIQEFRADYSNLVECIATNASPNAIFCTIYRPRFKPKTLRANGSTLLSVFNDTIIEVVSNWGYPIIDLRSVCYRKRHFANEIEPSTLGSLQMAKAIRDVLATHDFTSENTTIYGGY